jgi:protein-S-isoprenylcysteine O-methyltransferase Ste14
MRPRRALDRSPFPHRTDCATASCESTDTGERADEGDRQQATGQGFGAAKGLAADFAAGGGLIALEQSRTGGMGPDLPNAASPRWLRTCGDFFFRYRNVVFPLALASLCIGFPPRLPGGSLAIDRWLDLLGLVLTLAGQALRAAVIGFAYVKRGGRNKRVYAATLITTGLFGVCRNPLYLGNGLIIAGLLTIQGNPVTGLLGLLFFAFAYLSIVASEESFLIGKFGAAYLDYCRDVPRWWPNFGSLAEATEGMRFDWRRVIATEYGTVFTWAATAALLFAYDAVHDAGLAGARPRLLATGGLIAALGALALAIRHLKKSGRLAPAWT